LKPDAEQFFFTHVEDYDDLHYGDRARSLMSDRLGIMAEALRELDLPRGAKLLDAGCGPGRFLSVASRLGLRVVGADTSMGMLCASRDADVPTLLGLARSSIEFLPFDDGTFDVVCTAGVLEYLPSDETALGELVRVLRPGGALLAAVTNFWSPAGYLDFAVEALKRRPRVLEPFNRAWTSFGRTAIRPRHFAVRRQLPGRFRKALAALEIGIECDRYFHYLPWPHPFDRLLPGATAALGRRMDRLSSTWLAPLGEGYLAVGRKSIEQSDPGRSD
jgi:SAM-dependent methyltransferase